MKKIISITLVLSMVLSLMTFGTFTASADTSFVDYIIYNDLDADSDDGLYDIFGAGSQFNGDNVYTPVRTLNGAAHYVGKPGTLTDNVTPTVLYYSVPIEGKTQPIVVDYYATMTGSKAYYVPQISCNSTGMNVVEAGNYAAQRVFLSYSATANSGFKVSSAHTMYLNRNTAHYQFVIDPVALTVTPYKDGVADSHVKSINEGVSNVYLAHAFNTVHANNTSDTATNGFYFDLHYMAAYNDAATPDFEIKSYTANEAVVQFNTPVTADVAAAMTVDGVAVSAVEDLSKAEDQVNTFKLTFASALTMGSHTIAATGTSLTGKTINASKALDIALVEPLSVGGVVLDSVENAFFKDGSVISVRAANNGAVTLENDGTLLFKQNDDATAVADVRFKTVPLNPNGDQTGKVVLDFDVTSSRSTNAMAIKYGSTNSSCDNLYSLAFDRGMGRVINYKIIIDYDNAAYSLYVDGVRTELISTTTSAYVNTKTSALMIFFMNVNEDANGNKGYCTIENFAAYKVPSSTLDYAVMGSVAKDGGKAVQFTMPVDTVNSVATINGKQYGLVNAHKSGFVNAYAVDTADLDAGTYDVVLTAKALEDSTKTATVNFQITLTGDKVIFTNSSATITDGIGRVTVTAENNRNSEIRPMILVAEYDSQDVFDDVDSVRTYINAYDTVNLSGRNNVNEGSYIKGYIWDSVTSAKPYCAAIEQ